MSEHLFIDPGAHTPAMIEYRYVRALTAAERATILARPANVAKIATGCDLLAATFGPKFRAKKAKLVTKGAKNGWADRPAPATPAEFLTP